MSQTRKLAAILAVDVVGYLRLMGEDEASRIGQFRILAANGTIPKRRGRRGRSDCEFER